MVTAEKNIFETILKNSFKLNHAYLMQRIFTNIVIIHSMEFVLRKLIILFMHGMKRTLRSAENQKVFK